MTLTHLPEHGIRHAHIEPSVAHVTFANESGMDAFLRDNKATIRLQCVQWDTEWRPLITITAK